MQEMQVLLKSKLNLSRILMILPQANSVIWISLDLNVTPKCASRLSTIKLRNSLRKLLASRSALELVSQLPEPLVKIVLSCFVRAGHQFRLSCSKMKKLARVCWHTLQRSPTSQLLRLLQMFWSQMAQFQVPLNKSNFKLRSFGVSTSLSPLFHLLLLMLLEESRTRVLNLVKPRVK